MEQITSELLNITLNNNDLKYINELEEELEKVLGMELDDNSYSILVKIKTFAFKKGVNAGLNFINNLNRTQ